jgi:membrane-bound lytic murein transglycosylase B
VALATLVLVVGAPSAAAADQAASSEGIADELVASSVLDSSVPAVSVPDVLPQLSLAELLPDSERFHPDVMAQVRLDLGRVQWLVDDLTLAYVRRDVAIENRLIGLGERARLRVERLSEQNTLDDRLEVHAAAETAAEVAFAELASYGVSTFVGTLDLELEKVQFDGISSPIPELTDSVEGVLTHQLALARAELAASRLAVAETEQSIRRLDEALVVADDRILTAEIERDAASADIEELAPQFEATLSGLAVAGTDIPVVVIDAYFKAQLITAETRPSCQVSWDQLAGIGLIETRHGSFGGSSVGPDGRTSKKILGPVLDGQQFAAISDTDGGALDGNTVWDRAVGPMQFIPGSWKIYGQDANSDGIEDPHNIYDAALSAAEHLCRSTGGLAGDGNFSVALRGYNNSEQYGLDVMAARTRYRRAVQLSPGSPTPRPVVIDYEDLAS